MFGTMLTFFPNLEKCSDENFSKLAFQTTCLERRLDMPCTCNQSAVAQRMFDEVGFIANNRPVRTDDEYFSILDEVHLKWKEYVEREKISEEDDGFDSMIKARLPELYRAWMARRNSWKKR